MNWHIGQLWSLSTSSECALSKHEYSACSATVHTYWTHLQHTRLSCVLCFTSSVFLYCTHVTLHALKVIIRWNYLKQTLDFEKYKQKHNSSCCYLHLPPQSMPLSHHIWLNFIPKGNLLIVILLTTKKLLENLLISPFWLKPPSLTHLSYYCINLDYLSYVSTCF